MRVVVGAQVGFVLVHATVALGTKLAVESALCLSSGRGLRRRQGLVALFVIVSICPRTKWCLLCWLTGGMADEGFYVMATRVVVEAGAEVDSAAKLRRDDLTSGSSMLLQWGPGKGTPAPPNVTVEITKSQRSTHDALDFLVFRNSSLVTRHSFESTSYFSLDDWRY